MRSTNRTAEKTEHDAVTNLRHRIRTKASTLSSPTTTTTSTTTTSRDDSSSSSNPQIMASQVGNEKGEEVVLMHESDGVENGYDYDYDRDHDELDDATNNRNDWKSVVVGILYASLSKWFDAGIMVLLIFGGCCGNVFALEAIIKDEPASGPLITFVQFVTVSLFTLPSFLSWSAGPSSFFMKAPVIPLRSWTVYTIFFVTVNLLNNWAFAYRISVPLHIILRSGGPSASMIIGYWYNGRRYSRLQIFSVMLVTFGVVAAALADAKAQGKAIDLSSNSPKNVEGASSTLTFVTGFTILALAMLLSAFQGVYADRLYAVHGNTHWREALLYSHMLSLPFFLPTYGQLSAQFRAFLSSPSVLADIDPTGAASATATIVPRMLLGKNTTLSSLSQMAASSLPAIVSPLPASATVSASSAISSSLVNHTSALNSSVSSLFSSTAPAFSSLLTAILAKTPSKIFYLIINALTQYICIRGVYLLAAKSSSLTVTIVLNIRKLVSLLLSIYIFGNSLASGVLIGGAFVFLGGALYGIGSAKAKNSLKMSSSAATAAASMEMQYRHHSDSKGKKAKRNSGLVASYFNSSASTPVRDRSPANRKKKVKV